MGNVGLRKNKVGFLDYDLSKRIVNDAHLEENLQFFAEKEKEKLKLIFIGPHGSGKTTILRQLRQIHGDQYSEEELGQFLSVIHQNLINSMKILLEQCKRLGITGRVGPQKSLETITKYSGRTEFLPENIMFAIRLLWADPVIQSVWGMRAEYQINWTVQHFHDKCVSIAQPGYLPDNSDILRCDFPTAGITRELYDIEGSPFEIYDVGRHRGEKGRASQIYDNVSAIVFVADLTEYDQYKIDNGSRKNRLADSMEKFELICVNPNFRFSTIVLFLNKVDLLEAKLKRCRLKDVPQFNDYRGSDGNLLQSVSYIRKKFLELSKKSVVQGRVVVQVVCALDTEAVSAAVIECKEAIVNRIDMDQAISMGSMPLEFSSLGIATPTPTPPLKQLSNNNNQHNSEYFSMSALPSLTRQSDYSDCYK